MCQHFSALYPICEERVRIGVWQEGDTGEVKLCFFKGLDLTRKSMLCVILWMLSLLCTSNLLGWFFRSHDHFYSREQKRLTSKL